MLRLIANDENSRLVIYFHGNAGTVGQTRRTEAYRSITAGDSEHIYVRAFDYRGFGRLSGYPTEPGLITDALSVLDWALQKGKFSSKHIVLVSQSLGTVLATAAVERYASESPPLEFGGIITCAAFTKAVDVFINYSVFGTMPLLAPLHYLPWLQKWFASSIADTWMTCKRLQSLVIKTKSLRLTMVHATNDEVIPCSMLSVLSETVLDTLRDHGIDSEHKVELGDGGETEAWTSGERVIRKIRLHHGGHNTIMKWAPVAFEVAKIFEQVNGNES